MTRSLLLNSAGDLSVLGRSTRLVSGTEKLIQDLNCWLRESYGVDRFHRSYGSVLPSFIGHVISDSAVFDIEAETRRVLNNYMALQLRRLQATPAVFSRAELLDEVISVDATPAYDRVDVHIKIRTAAGQVGNLKVGVTP